jgi:pyruvate ferredoxin oxidoreductase gamma subunit
MLAAVVKVSKVIEEHKFVEDMRHSFEHKFHSKPSVIEGNMNALRQTLREVKVG